MSSYPSDLPTGDSDEAAIIAGWQEYWRVFEKFAADPNGFTDFTETQEVTRDQASQLILNEISNMREQGIQAFGGQQFEDVSVGSLRTEGGLRYAEVSYCAINTALDIRYEDTGEPFEGGIADRYLETFTMQEGKDGIWRASDISNEADGC